MSSVCIRPLSCSPLYYMLVPHDVVQVHDVLHAGAVLAASGGDHLRLLQDLHLCQGLVATMS